MATNIYVSYFNAFGIKSATNTGVIPNTNTKNWHVEESRIKGGFNEDSVNLGVRAYLVNDEQNVTTNRFNAMIYSGVYNSRTNVNETNVFSAGTDITKAAEPAYGSIQKLYAEDTNLTIYQENKISRALIDKELTDPCKPPKVAASTLIVISYL